MKSVAVVGMACRLPGGLDSISSLWSGMMDKVVTADTVPADRWDAERYCSEDPGSPAKAYVKRGNFLKQDVRSFDAAFFDLPPKVAENLDPQQRLMLEVVWEAFENAGLDLPAHAGANVGVYVGGFMLDHMITLMDMPNRNLINQNTAAGMMMTMLSNRISHAFDFRGPSLSIDTACSSSLTAFNYGFQDIRTGKADVAVVGGVNVMTRPEYPVGMCKGQFLSPDGMCKSFDKRGDGYGRGEGAGVLVLKDLEKAIADGDEILATVVGAGVNSDGRTPGISMPSGDAQRQLVEDVCAEYDIAPDSVHYVECHGTGTAVGDPIEANSVGSVFGKGREGDDRLVIGSIKSNIGHTEAAAGVAGLIKAVLTLQHRVVPPLGNFEEAHPDIPFDELGVRLPIEATPIGKPGQPVRVAVNSFGYGGTNAHAVLESAPEHIARPVKEAPKTTASDFPKMLPISARSGKALTALAASYADRLEGVDAEGLDDVLFSASSHRSHLSNRAVAIGKDAAELKAALAAFADGTALDEISLVTGDTVFGGRDEPVFVYTGMGPQWWGMGQQLYKENAVFKAALDEADAAFKKVAGFSILAEMQKDEESSEITKTEFAQPANFLVQYGLTKILEDAGVAPGAIVGHSVGEVSSSWAAGALTLEDAVTVSYHRSRTQAKTAGSGSMLAVGLSAEALSAYLEEFGTEIDIAAINGPATLTVAGNTVAIRRLAEKLEADEVFNRELQVEVPYHSHLMDPVLGELTEALADVKPSVPSRTLFSTVSGAQVTDIAYDAAYWCENVRQPVSFMKAIMALMEEGYTNFIEIGPHPVLRSALRECSRAAGKEIRQAETLRRGEPETPRMHKAVGQVFANGAPIDWALHNGAGAFVDLPNYPWQREEYWIETDNAKADRIYSTEYPMLGTPWAGAGRLWRNDFDYDAVAYLRDHVVTGAAIMPAAGYIETLLELGRHFLPEGSSVEIRNAEIASPLVLAKERMTEYATFYDIESRSATIRSAEIGVVSGGQLHMSAEIGAAIHPLTDAINREELVADFDPAMDVATLYSVLADSGLQYGPAFQSIKHVQFKPGTGEGIAQIALPEMLERDADKYILHPSMLDGCFQMLIGILQGEDTMYLPTGFRSIRVLTEHMPNTFWCHGELVSKTAKQIICDLTLFDDEGRVLATVRGMEATAGAALAKTRTDKFGDEVKLLALGQKWTNAGMLAEPRRVGDWLVVSDEDGSMAEKIAEGMENNSALPPRMVKLGDAWGTDADGFTIRGGHDEDARRLLKEAGKLDGIVFVNGLDATPESDDPTAEKAIAAMIGVFKAITEMPVAERPRVYVLTQNAYQAESSDKVTSPPQRAINGAVRVAHNEIEGAKISSIDLPKRINDRVTDALFAELLCDAEEDEVALRGGRRLFSEMMETDEAEAALLEERMITDEAPVRARPTKSTTTEAMVDLMPITLPELGADDLRLTVKSMSIPAALIADTSKETFDEEYINVVGQIAAVGKSVKDLKAGDMVFGFVPADFASHIQGPRSNFHLAHLPEGVKHQAALDAIASKALAIYGADAAGLAEGNVALARGTDPMSVAIADALEANGVVVHRVGSESEPATAAAIDALMDKTANGAGFDAIIAPMQDWMRDFGANCLVGGGVLVDADASASPMLTPSHVSAIVRTDIDVVTGRSARLKAALERTAELLTTEEPTGSAGIAIDLSNIMEETLEVPSMDLRIDLVFDTDKGPLPVASNSSLEITGEGSFLVTGGLGGFGQKTCRWLVDLGCKSLVIASRSGANTKDKKDFVADIEALGVRVETPKCDLSEPDAVAALIEDIQANNLPLKGVFHAAAVIEDADISEIDYKSYEKVMRSKALAAHALHEATKDIELDHFVLFSSVANPVGNKRQLPYSAANGYLDGLAAARQAAGLPGVSINWGAIGGAGVLEEDEATEQFLKYIGIRPIDVDEALTLMQKTMERNIPQIAYLLMTNWNDWARYEVLGAASPRFADLIANDLEAARGGDSEVRAQLIEQLSELDASERFEVFSGLVREVIAGELRVDADGLSIDRPINELGVDSLMAAEIQMVLESDLAISISVMDMLSGATIRSIVERTLADFGFVESIAAE